MIDGIFVDSFEDFLEWYAQLNPNDTIDMHETMLIYFNLETYGEGI